MNFDYDSFSKILMMILLPFIFVVAVMPFIKRLAKRVNAIDVPRGRHIHKKPTPVL